MTDTVDPADPDDTVRPARPASLSLVARGSDRRRLLLVDDEGREFTLEITPDLRVAVRGDAPRRWETPMSSSIRPREIQTRIRAGESAETVAEAAGTSVEAIMPYVAPVLAERAHVAERAQKASVRRTPGEGQSGPTQSRILGDAVAAHLRERGDDPEAVVWDAYRRETGRWVLTGTFEAAERGGVARFTYDAPGSYVLSDNDDARWLIGDLVAVAAAAAPAQDDLRPVRERRLAAVPEELPLGGEADQLPLGDSVDQALDLIDEPARAGGPEQEAARETAQESQESPEARAEAEAEAERARHRRPVQKKRGRASVPSWDEIMFGGGDQ